ncbi:MAG: hypothetical protein Alpg2KO_11920 [Alphaproteobacteria bacterium]
MTAVLQYSGSMKRLSTDLDLKQMLSPRIMAGIGLMAMLLCAGIGLFIWWQPSHQFDVSGSDAPLDHRASHPTRANCQVHHDAGARDSGLYTIDTGLLMQETTVWCEMRQGEGWTLVLHATKPDDQDWNTSRSILPSELPSPNVKQNYKLADRVINQIAEGGVFLVENTAESVLFEAEGCAYRHSAKRVAEKSGCQYSTCQPLSARQQMQIITQGRYVQKGNWICDASRQGIEIYYEIVTQQGNRIRPTAATNDVVLQQATLSSFLTKRKDWLARHRCSLSHGTPSQSASLKQKLAYARCLNEARPKLYSRFNIMPPGQPISMYVRHPSADHSPSP